MKSIKISILFFLVFSSFSLSMASDLHLFLAIQPENVGDSDQVRALAAELKKNFTEGKVELSELNLLNTKPKEIRDHIQTHIQAHILAQTDPGTLYLLLAVSTDGVGVIQMSSGVNGLKTVYLAHQISENYSEVVDRATICVLPKHAVTESLLKTIAHSKTHLIQTIGVLHGLRQPDLIQEYEKNKKVIPQAASYLGVILGGDAPTSDGKIKYFSKKEAENLAEYVGKKAQKQNSTVLILNGPRTGKYNPETGLVDPLAHRADRLDAVTSAFQKKLQAFIPNTQISLYDFQLGQTSYYKTVLGAILKKSGVLLVPGESTSMVSETVENLPTRVYVYENGAMNPVHFAHVKSEYAAGRVHLLSHDFQEYPSKLDQNSFIENQSAAVAKEILKILMK